MTHPASGTRTYLAIWVWLAGLMLLSVVLAQLAISKTAIVLIVLGLSTIKALLVALYYMHLKIDRRLLTFIALVPFIIVLFALGVLCSSRFVRL